MRLFSAFLAPWDLRILTIQSGCLFCIRSVPGRAFKVQTLNFLNELAFGGHSAGTEIHPSLEINFNAENQICHCSFYEFKLVITLSVPSSTLPLE